MNRRRVLIETLWNVKINEWIHCREKSHVLIETLWNVKRFSPVPVPLLTGINRNIVECKVAP